MKDPFGTLLVAIRDDAAVAAIVGSGSAARVSADAEEPPSVRLAAGPTSRVPFGTGSGRVGMQGFTLLAFCYGPLGPTGPIVARQLAGAVSDVLHGLGPVHGSTYLARVWAPDIGDLLIDPDTKWPYHTVRAIAYAAAQAVTL